MELLFIPLLIFFPLVFLLRKLNPRPKRPARYPPGPWNLPFIGSLHHLLRPEPPHQTFRRLSALHGPIMRLKLGEINAVVISSPAAAKEILKTNDVAFASRPVTSSINAICYGGNDIAFSPYGEFWRQMRRLCLLELFSVKRVRSFRSIREEEVSDLIQSIAAAAELGTALDLSSKFSQLSNNITTRAVVGGRSSDQKLFQSAVAGVVELASGFTAVDLFPSMPFIARVTGFQRKLDQCQQKLDHINEEIIRVHRRKRSKLFTEEDITDVLLRIQEEDNLPFPLTNDHIKAVINDLLVAGTDTTANTIEWAMSELIRNPAVKQRLQFEVREAFGCGRQNKLVDEGLMSGGGGGGGLSYLQLVVKETLRLHPPVPLLLPRENRERCEVMGYEIPAKTTVMVNAWAIGRDPSSWDEPDAFRPERFEGSAVDFKGGHLELIPFGAGRRICPGMQFGLATVELALAHMLYYFDWEYSRGRGEDLDMAEAFGIATKRKLPLCLLPVPRIPLPAASLHV